MIEKMAKRPSAKPVLSFTVPSNATRERDDGKSEVVVGATRTAIVEEVDDADHEEHVDEETQQKVGHANWLDQFGAYIDKIWIHRWCIINN